MDGGVERENFYNFSVGRDKPTNLAIRDGGILEVGKGTMLHIGEYFDENQNTTKVGNKSIVKVIGTNSKINGDISVSNGELQILDSAILDKINYIEIGSMPYNGQSSGKILLDKGSLIANEFDFDGDDINPTLEAKNGSTIKIKEFYNDNTGSPIINLDNSTFELADNVDNDKFDMVTLNIRNNSNFNINNNSLRTSKPINISNSSNLKAGDLRAIADSVTIDSGSKADFSGAVRTEGGTLTVSGENTTLNVGHFLRAGQAQYDALDKNNQPYTEYEKSGLIDIKDKAKVSANDVRVRDVMNVNNANLDTKNISIGISEGAIDEEEGRTYKEKSGTLNITNNSNINANTLSLYKGVANFKNSILFADEIDAENGDIIFTSNNPNKSTITINKQLTLSDDGTITFDNVGLKFNGDKIKTSETGKFIIKNKFVFEGLKDATMNSVSLKSDEAATLIKDGKGTFSLTNFNNTNFKGNLGVNSGTLNLDGDYNLENGKTLTIGAKSLNQTGKLTANSVKLASGSNIVIENSFDDSLKNTLKNLENDKEFTNPIISARNTLTDDGVKVKDSSAEFSYDVKKVGNDLKLVVKGLDKLEELGGKVVKEDSKFNKTENISDKQVFENGTPLTEDGKKVTAKVEKKLVLGKDAKVISKGNGSDKTAILVAENGNVVNQGKIDADSLIVKKDGAFYADTSSQATLEELKLNSANFEAKKESKVSINKFNDDEESKSTIKGDVTLTEDNTVKGEFKADENSKLTLQGDTNFEKKLVANKSNINSQTKTITANKGVDLTKTDVKVANLTVKEAVDIDGGILSGVKNINIDNLAQDSTIKDVKIENDDKLKVDIKTEDKNLLLKNVIANNIDHFEFSGHKLTIESGDIKVTGANTFKYDGDGTNGSEALMNNAANVETINAIFGETQNTTVTVDDKSKFTVKDTLNLGVVGNPNGEKTVTLNLKGKSTTDVKNNIIINKDITANINLDDATLNVNTITKESDAKALNLVAKNSTLNFLADNASLFAGVADQDKIEVDNATFKTDKNNNLGTKISGKNLIKAGNGVLTVENGQKKMGWN